MRSWFFRAGIGFGALGLLLSFGMLKGRGAAAADGETLDSLTARQFLVYARRPFRGNAWVRASGYVQFRGKGDRGKPRMTLAIRYRPDGMRVQVVLDDRWCTTLEETHGLGAAPEIRFIEHPAEDGINLKKLGIEPQDITFSFLYWDIVRELPTDSVRGQPCRVLVLEQPGTGERVRAWFHTKYAFPLRAWWFHPGADTPWRKLEFKHFKKFGKFWFVKELALYGADWKTRVVFKKVDMAATDERPAPPNLFRSPPPASAR